jgi:hypothetical protein
MSGARAVQRFWYGWKMWSFAFTATQRVSPSAAILKSLAVLFGDENLREHVWHSSRDSGRIEFRNDTV